MAQGGGEGAGGSGTEAAVHHPGKTHTFILTLPKHPHTGKMAPTPHAKPPQLHLPRWTGQCWTRAQPCSASHRVGAHVGPLLTAPAGQEGRSGSSSRLLPPAGDPQPPGSSLPCHFSPWRILGGTLGLRALGNPEKATAPAPHEHWRVTHPSPTHHAFPSGLRSRAEIPIGVLCSGRPQRFLLTRASCISSHASKDVLPLAWLLPCMPGWTGGIIPLDH